MSKSRPDAMELAAAAEARATALDALTEAVLTRTKYQDLAPAFVRAVAAAELAKGRKYKDTLKATRNKLHQVASAYRIDRPNTVGWLRQVRALIDDGEDVRPLCEQMMRHHASTRERLPVLYSFYATLLGDLSAVTSVLDLACGLNPLALPWMPLASDVYYTACDVFQDQIHFLNGWFDAIGVRGHALVCDLLHGVPEVTCDVALLLKTVPCLEQMDRDVGRRLLTAIDAPVLIVSYPVRSLSGRNRSMQDNYAEHFAQLVEGHRWHIDRYDFATELVYRIRR